MEHEALVGVVLVGVLLLLGIGCDSDTGRNITKIQDDGEDFTVRGDEDGDGLNVISVRTVGERSITVNGRHNLGDPLSEAVLIADWSDGTNSERQADANGIWAFTHIYPEPGEYAVEIRCYCKLRLVRRDSDILLIRGAPGAGGSGTGGAGGDENG
jgi:hypothetical protein